MLSSIDVEISKVAIAAFPATAGPVLEHNTALFVWARVTCDAVARAPRPLRHNLAEVGTRSVHVADVLFQASFLSKACCTVGALKGTFAALCGGILNGGVILNGERVNKLPCTGKMHERLLRADVAQA